MNTQSVKAARMQALRRRLSELRRDEGGATILEFALISAPFFALLIAILITAIVFLYQQGLETTAEAAARLIMTGKAQSSSWNSSQYKSEVCKSLPPFLSCDDLMIDVQTVSSFTDANTNPPAITYDPKTGYVTNKWSYQTGSAGDIVVLRLMYIMPVATGPLGFDLSNTSPNHRLLVATSVAKTEPYPTS